MGLVELLLVASMPVIKVLIVTGVGSFLALDRFDIFGDTVRKNLNAIVFFVFNPALVYDNLAKTVTFESVVLLWFMPFNILITFVIGSALGWLLVKLTKPPQRLKGLVLGSCAAGNLGNMLLIIVPAVCREKGSPFGSPAVCHTYAMAYASLSMAVGAVYLWSYVYNIVRVSSSSCGSLQVMSSSLTEEGVHSSEAVKIIREPLLAQHPHDQVTLLPYTTTQSDQQINIKVMRSTASEKVKRFLTMVLKEINLQALLAPSTTGAIVGFMIGMVPPLRELLIGTSAPLRVVQDSASMLGDAAIPALTLIMGGNLLKGLKGGSGIKMSVVVGIIVVRYMLLPVLGIGIVKAALRLGLVKAADPLYLFVLLLQYALPPAMNIGTITQLFGAGESECSVIMLWTYALASVALTLWSTFFMWLVSSQAVTTQ